MPLGDGLGLWSQQPARPPGWRFSLVACLLGAGFSLGGSGAAATLNGGQGDLQWSARQLIVGQTSTNLLSSGGDGRYLAAMPRYSGVAALLMTFQNGAGLCTGSLLPDRVSILTAAHCVAGSVSSGALLGTAAWFYGGANPDSVVISNPLASSVAVSQVFIHPDYTGDVIDQNDIAVLRLSGTAPSFASSYGLSSLTELSGVNFNVAGYGRRSSVGGAAGANISSPLSVLRQGDNRFEFRLGDPLFGGDWSVILNEPASQIDQVYLADFDNGTSGNDAGCLVAASFSLSGPNVCNQGRGAMEVSTAPGDSGGPQFDASMNIAAITSFGLSFGTSYGDADGSLNSSWGEFAGFVPIATHRSFIEATMVPAPLTLSGALVALRLSRRLRRRLGNRPSGSSSARVRGRQRR